MNYTINSPIDNITAIKTVIVAGVFVVMSIIMFVNDLFWFGIGILILLLFLLVITYLGIPRRIIVTDNEILLENLGFNRVIRRDDIIKARRFTVEDKDGLWRKFAAEGLWGYCGIYSSSAHKKLYIYASQNRNWILIETIGKKYVISPKNLDIISIINQV